MYNNLKCVISYAKRITYHCADTVLIFAKWIDIVGVNGYAHYGDDPQNSANNPQH